MELRQIDLNLLPVLAALLETRSIKEAAVRVNLSASATSHALARLRDAFEDPLLVRAGQIMQRTARGDVLAAALVPALDSLAVAIRPSAEFDASTTRWSACLATTDYVEAVILPALGRRVARAAPGVDLHSVRIEDDVAQLRSGAADLLFGVLSYLPSDIRVAPLLHEDFVCVMRRGHPATERNLTLRRYAALDHLLVAPRGAPRGVVDRLLEEKGLERRVSRSVGSFLAAPYLLVESDLVLTVASRIAFPLAETLDLITCPPPLTMRGFDLSLAWHQRKEEDPAHRWLRELVVEVCSGL